MIRFYIIYGYYRVIMDQFCSNYWMKNYNLYDVGNVHASSSSDENVAYSRNIK